MSFAGPTDFITAKRHSTLDIDNLVLSSAPFDHFRIRVYRLENGGGETLVFTSDPFADGSAPEQFLLAAANDVGANEIGVDHGSFYRIDVVEFDTAETAENVNDEEFMFIWPDTILTVGTAEQGALDTSIFTKLLAMNGHNVLHGEYKAPNGYTQSRVLRHYATDLTDAEAEALLLTSVDPSDVNVTFKTKALLTITDEGNEQSSKETQEDVT